MVEDNKLVMSQRSSSVMYWSYANVDTSLTNYKLTSDAKTDFNGKSNTATIIAEDASNIAAKYCNNYTTAGTSAGDWYLPAVGELYSYVHGNYSAIKTAMTSIGWSCGGYIWSSSEYSSRNAWTVGTHNGDLGYHTKGSRNYLNCLLAIN